VPLVPPLAPVAPSTVPSQEWACALAGLVLTPADEFAYLLEGPVPDPAFSSDGIFHPPR
jgi:hypothetical protein